MKIIIGITLTLAFLTLSVAGQNGSKLLTYTSVEGRYSIDFPSQPTLKTQEAKDSDGDVVKQYLATVSENKSFYQVGYFDYGPPKTFKLPAARDGMIRAVNGTLVSEEKIEWKGAAGLEIKLSAMAGSRPIFSRARFYDAGGRAYVLNFVYYAEDDGAAVEREAKRFFDSFSFKKAN